MNCGLKTCSLWTVLAILACSLAGQAKDATSFEINLRNYGWEPPDRHQIERPSIVVGHDRRVLVGFAVRERKGLVTRTQPSLSFHVLRFSANGEVDLSVSLPTNAAGRTAVYFSDTDQIIVRANDSVQLLQSGEQKVQESVWKILARCTVQCQIEQSFSRRTLFLYSDDADPPVTIIRLSQLPALQLQRCGKPPRLIKSTEDKIQNYPQSITDEFAYFLGGEGAYRWPLCDFNHRVELPLNAQGRSTVLNDDLFVQDTHDLRKNQETLEVISADGHAKFRRDIAKHESADGLWAPIRSSERGDRIAVAILTTRGGNRTLDISSHVTALRIAVYDIEAGKELASVAVSAKHKYRFEFDLSPDGRRLAILEDDVVKVVDLEEAAKLAEHTEAVDLKDGPRHLQVPIPPTKPKQ
jgi:hypothetical protein